MRVTSCSGISAGEPGWLRIALHQVVVVASGATSCAHALLLLES